MRTARQRSNPANSDRILRFGPRPASGRGPFGPDASLVRRLVSPMRELEREQNTDSREHADLPPLAVIGPGRVGRTLVRAASGAGLRVSLSGRRHALAAGEQAE